MSVMERAWWSSRGLALASLVIVSVRPGVASAQHAPPIVTSFDGETLEDAADLPRPIAPSRPLPPIVTEFDGPLDEDEAASLEDQGPRDAGDAAPDDEDPAEARRLLQHAMLVERRRLMARAAQASNARLLASPFGPTEGPRAEGQDGHAEGHDDELPRAIDRLELAVASTNAPVTSIGLHDDGMRIRVGAGLDAFREPVGFRVRFEPLVVLQSAGTLSVPHEYVRTAFTTSVTYRTPLPSLPIALFVGGGYEHVGDYTTLGPSAFLLTNQLLVRGGMLFDGGVLHGLVRLSAGAHVLSDTTIEDDAGAQQSVEIAADVVLRSGSPAAALRNIQLCGAVHASYLAPDAPRILEEARVELTAGVCVREPTLGDLSLVLEVALGNESHWNRSRRTEHVGAALRWSL